MDFNFEDIFVYFLIVLIASMMINKLCLWINKYNVGWYWSQLSDIFDMFDLAKKTTNITLKVVYYAIAIVSPMCIFLFILYLIYYYR